MFTVVFSFRQQIKVFVQGLFDLDNDISAFKEHLRDFLVQIKVCKCFIDQKNWYCLQ